MKELERVEDKYGQLKGVSKMSRSRFEDLNRVYKKLQFIVAGQALNGKPSWIFLICKIKKWVINENYSPFKISSKYQTKLFSLIDFIFLYTISNARWWLTVLVRTSCVEGNWKYTKVDQDWKNEHLKGSYVSSSHALPNPRAVMVVLQNTHVAVVAMFCSPLFYYSARVTVSRIRGLFLR